VTVFLWDNYYHFNGRTLLRLNRTTKTKHENIDHFIGTGFVAAFNGGGEEAFN